MLTHTSLRGLFFRPRQSFIVLLSFIINILGPIGGLFARGKEGELVQGNSLLIKEGETLEVGRDTITKTPYTFVTGGVVYDAIPVLASELKAGKIVIAPKLQGENIVCILVQRSTPLDRSGFNITRVFTNSKDEVAITVQEKARTQTKIEPVLMVRNEEEAREVMRKIMEEAEIASSSI